MSNIWTDNIIFKHTSCYDCNNHCENIKNNFIDLYIVVTRQCNAGCPFCVYKNNDTLLDLSVIEKILIDLSKVCQIGTIHFTGGEPTIKAKDLIGICNIAKYIFPNVKTSVNTNGLYLSELKRVDVLDNIALSRHHYDDDKNKKIFKTDSVPNTKAILNFPDKNKLHLSCNLIRGYIDNEKEIQKYLEYASKLRINDVGLVTLMKVNDYCKKQFVDDKQINLKNIPNFIKNRWFCEKENNTIYCRCENFLYRAENMNLISMYHRYAVKNNKISNYLVFENNHIMQGFNGKVLY